MVLIPSVRPAHRAGPLSAAKTVTYRMTPTAFIIDKDPDARKSLGRLLDASGVSVETFSSAAEFLKQFSPDRPGCVVYDVRSAGMDGLEFQDRLRALGSELPVLLLTAPGDVPTAVRAIRGGAFHALEKPDAARFLPDAVREAFACESAGLPDLPDRQKIGRWLDSLTGREREVAALVFEGKAAAEIAEQFGITRKTVETHRANVVRKMREQGVSHLVRLTLRHCAQNALNGQPPEKDAPPG